MTQPELDAATRARIRAEEAERLKVREELTREQRIKARPGYWTGALLNLLVTGAGLMYIGRVGAGLAWLIAAVVLSLVTTPVIGWPVGIIGSFWQYDTVYGQLYATEAEKAHERNAGKTTRVLVGVILGLLALMWVLVQLTT